MMKYFLDGKEVDEKIYQSNIRNDEKRYFLNDVCPVKEIVLHKGQISAYIINSDDPSQLKYHCDKCDVDLAIEDVYAERCTDDVYCSECNNIVTSK